MKQIILPALLMLLGFAACKKSDPVPVHPPSSSFTDKNWKLSALTVSPAMMGVTDLYNDLYEDCERDNLHKFISNGSFEINEGPTKCSAWDEQVIYGSWTYDTATGAISFNTGGDVYKIFVTEVTTTHFKGYALDDLGGTMYTSNWTFIKM